MGEHRRQPELGALRGDFCEMALVRFVESATKPPEHHCQCGQRVDTKDKQQNGYCDYEEDSRNSESDCDARPERCHVQVLVLSESAAQPEAKRG
jgi:hypothetical protein